MPICKLGSSAGPSGKISRSFSMVLTKWLILLVNLPCLIFMLHTVRAIKNMKKYAKTKSVTAIGCMGALEPVSTEMYP